MLQDLNHTLHFRMAHQPTLASIPKNSLQHETILKRNDRRGSHTATHMQYLASMFSFFNSPNEILSPNAKLTLATVPLQIVLSVLENSSFLQNRGAQTIDCH